MLDPPVSTPISRITANAASRIIWYSLSVSVCTGATVMESPVCTPMGSKFSMEQTTTQLSIRSRITSISNSFQPTSDHIELLAIVSDATASSAESKRRSNDERKCADLADDPVEIRQRTRDAGARHLEPDAQHRFLEQLPVFAFGDGLSICS